MSLNKDQWQQVKVFSKQEPTIMIAFTESSLLYTSNTPRIRDLLAGLHLRRHTQVVTYIIGSYEMHVTNIKSWVKHLLLWQHSFRHWQILSMLTNFLVVVPTIKDYIFHTRPTFGIKGFLHRKCILDLQCCWLTLSIFLFHFSPSLYSYKIFQYGKNDIFIFDNNLGLIKF